MKLSYYIFLLIIFLSACSTTTEQAHVEERKSYSEETLDFFNRIENTKSHILKSPQQSTNRNDDLDEGDNLKTIVIETPTQKVIRRRAPEPRPRPVPATLPKRVIVEESSNESLIEIQQHISYYCMERNNLSKFRNSESLCESFGQQVLNSCKKAIGTINKKTVQCVLNNLKKG